MESVRVQLARLWGNSQAVICLAGIAGVLFVPAFALIVFGKAGWGVVILLPALLIATLVGVSRQSYNGLAATSAERRLLSYMGKVGMKSFDLDKALEGERLPKQAVSQATLALYERAVGRVLADGKISEKERRGLDLLAEKLRIRSVTAQRIEDRGKISVYKNALEQHLSDGELSEKEAHDLTVLRDEIGLDASEAFSATRTDVRDAYRALFRRFASDGRLMPAEMDAMRRFREATGLGLQEAMDISMKDALDLFRRTVANICQDGEVTPEEMKGLSILQDALGVSGPEVASSLEEVRRVQHLSGIRKGGLPKVDADDLHLRSTELCHWRGPCRYTYRTKTKQIALNGSLIVTNGRLIFTAETRSIQVSLKRIINIQPYTNAVRLDLSTSRGKGLYEVEDGEVLGAILEALVTRVNFVVAEKMESARVRHIADSVKVAVWARDGGRCVRCDATEYLEFDHIIPFSKGGANSERNIQLLCRKCNLAKGAELV